MAEWWRGAVIYQIYPRSFADSNGDGVGDLRGAMEKLDHVASLGADGVWLSPVFASPMKDFGYDVSDYRAIDPLFGTMADFDAFLARAHALGLKVIIDQVYSHTSDEHAWFKESRASRDNPKADWYVWADAKPDGSPPNNWQSLFGGSSWEWDTRRRQYYLHNFLREQPDLNVRNPAVQDAILDVARFWLDKGVDGFRLDVINFLIQDEKLRDNPSRNWPKDKPPKQPHAFQKHKWDRSQPETLEFVARFRALLDSYPDRFAVGEIEDEEPITRQLEYCDGPERLHTAYSFELLRAREAASQDFAEALYPWNGDAWPSWSLSNHDVPRFATRMAGDDPRLTRVLMAALLTLYGTIFLYQGDELGLPQAHVPFEALRDPEAIRFWPEGIGRDGARTPMPWTGVGGFSSNATPWLPIDPRHLALNAQAQTADATSMLAFTRKLIALRKTHAALRVGRSIALGAPVNVFANARIDDVERITCAFNFKNAEQVFSDGNLDQAERLDCGLASEMRGSEVILAPYGGAMFRMRRSDYKSNSQ